MPINLFSILNRRRAKSLADDSSEPRATPEPRHSQSENPLPRTSISSPFERRIHPDLNALAAELSSSSPPLSDARRSSEASPSQSSSNPDNTIPFVSLTPWLRIRRNSSGAHSPTSPIQDTNASHGTRLEHLSESNTSLSTISHRNAESNAASPTPSSESRANRIINRLTGLGNRGSASPTPPSAWNTFGRSRKSRRNNSIPHMSDFGASPDISLSSSQRSHGSSSQTSPSHPGDISGDTSGSFSLPPTNSQPHSRSHSVHTPHTRPSHTPPSSGFTFGYSRQVPNSPISAYPALRLSLFGSDDDGMTENRQNEVVPEETNSGFSFNIESSTHPRPSSSMPSISRTRLEPNESLTFRAESSRPRAQDIFATSSSSDLHARSSHRRRRRDANRSARSRSSSKHRRTPRTTTREVFCSISAEMPVGSRSTSVGPLETRADNVKMSEGLGTPFRLQHGPSGGPSGPTDETPNLSAIANTSIPSLPSRRDSERSQENMVAGTPPRKSSPIPGGSGDERQSPKPRVKGKGKQRESSSRPSSPLRNVTPPSVLAEFPVPPLPSSRSSTPRRSAMASSSRFRSPSPTPSDSQPIPLATTASASSLGKGKRKADEVDGGSEHVSGSTTSPDVKKQQKQVHRATFAAEPRTHRTSSSSYAASQSARNKRARLSSGTSFATSVDQTVSEHPSRAPSRAGSQHHHHASYSYTGTPHPVMRGGRPSSRGSRTPTQSVRAPSASSHQQHSVRHASRSQRARKPSSTRGSSRRNSVSQASIPISALISPHAPSISLNRSTAYHMRDPRKPSPVHSTPWSLTFPSAGPGERGWLSGCFDAILCANWGAGALARKGFGKFRSRAKEEEEQDLEKQASSRDDEPRPVVDWTEGGGSPLHAWLFFLGFILFPVWWIASVIGIPKTRHLGGDGPSGGIGSEKGVILDDPQVEHDAKSWRTRCRVMAGISLLTYVPFIVLVVIFVPRSQR